MHKKILCIDILKNDVYMEYTDGDIEYISFTKAKQIIYATQQETFTVSCADEERSNNFLNLLLRRYKIENSTLLLR